MYHSPLDRRITFEVIKGVDKTQCFLIFQDTFIFIFLIENEKVYLRNSNQTIAELFQF